MHSWNKNWATSFRDILHRQGYVDAFDFVLAHSGLSFGQMFGIIRSYASESDAISLGYAHLEEAYYLDAMEKGKLRMAVMEAFVRSMRQCLASGWNQGKHCIVRRIHSRSKWPVPHCLTQINMTHLEWRQFQIAVWKRVELISPPNHWCPEDYSDSTVANVFDYVWPREREIAELKPRWECL